MAGHGIGGITGPVLVRAGQQYIGRHVGSGTLLRQNREMHMPDAAHGLQRRLALGLQFGGAAQVNDGRQADVVHQVRNVGGRQFLQVVAAQQPAAGRPATVARSQPAQVTDIDGPVKLDPRHTTILAAPVGCPAGRGRQLRGNSAGWYGQ